MTEIDYFTPCTCMWSSNAVMYHVHCNWQTTDMYTNIATGTGNPCTSARGKIIGMSVCITIVITCQV